MKPVTVKKPAQKDKIACAILAVAETEAEMSPNQKSENTKLFELSPSISRPANACQASSKPKEMKRWVLATLLWKRKPALIPIVGIRVRESTQKLGEEEAQAHNTE